MPKLVNRPPKYGKMGKYAFVTHNRKRIYLGLYGSPESHEAYARFVAERRLRPDLVVPRGESNVAVKELAATFLDHAKATFAKPNYIHFRTVILEFLTKFYGNTPVDEFKPSSLKTIRSELIQAIGKDGKPRYCRGTINDHVRRITRIFHWGVGEELVKADTWAVLQAVKPLPEGHEGTFESPAREDVSDDVILRTLPFLPPVLQAMVKVQRLTGCRPGEIFNMRVGEIDRNADSDLWLYPPENFPRRLTVAETSFYGIRRRLRIGRIIVSPSRLQVPPLPVLSNESDRKRISGNVKRRLTRLWNATEPARSRNTTSAG